MEVGVVLNKEESGCRDRNGYLSGDYRLRSRMFLRDEYVQLFLVLLEMRVTDTVGKIRVA